MKDVYYEQIKKKREEIFKERQNLQIEKDSWEKLFSEQKARLEQEIEFFKQYNQNHEKKILDEKEEEKISKIRDNYKNKEIKSKIEELKSLYDKKLHKFTNQKKNFETEKENFEKYKNDATNNLEIKKIEIEQNNLELLKQNSEINKRYNDLKIKEMYLKDKYEDFLRIKNIVENKEKINIKYERDLQLAAERISKYTDEINDKENYIEKEKVELLKKNNEVQERQKIIENEKMNLEQEKAELNLKYQYLKTFSYNSPNVKYDNDVNIYNMKTSIENNNNINLNNNYDKDIQFNNNDNYNYDKNMINFGIYNNFNANKYICAVKDRIENGQRLYDNKYKKKGSKLDIAKERVYINKCNGAFSGIK